MIIDRHLSTPSTPQSSKHPNSVTAHLSRLIHCPNSFNSHRLLSAGVSDWDLVALGPRAVLQEEVTVSAAQLDPGGVIALQRVVVDALVETGAHIPAGAHISQAVAPLTCDAPSKGTRLQCCAHDDDDEGCAHHEGRPLLPWLVAMCARGLGAALCDAALLALALAMYLFLGLPTLGSLSSILSDLILVAPIWKILLLGTGALTIAATLRPLAFAAWLIGVRRVFVPLVVDGDCADHSAGSIFLELALRSQEVQLIDFMCGLINRAWVARAFGMRIAAARGFLPLPRMDRPELVSIGEGSYTGGGVTLCTRQVNASGATYRQISIDCDSFLAYGTVLMPGTSFGPRAVLGNRSLGVAGEDYSNAVFMGQKGDSALAGRGEARADIAISRSQSDRTGASAMRLMTMRGGHHLVPGESSSIRPHEVPTEGSSVTPILLVLLCFAFLRSVDTLILLAMLLTRRLLGLSSIGIAILFLLALVCAPWLRILWCLGVTRLCKRFLVGSFRKEFPAKHGSRAAVRRQIFRFLLSYLDHVAEPLKGSIIYNAMQRALGAKVGRGVCWLGRQHVKRSLGYPCS